MVASGTESEGFTLLRTKLSSFGRQVVIAMILVGMIIGSAIATTILAFLEPVGPSGRSRAGCPTLALRQPWSSGS